MIGTLRAKFAAPSASLDIKIRLISNVMDILADNQRTAGELTKCDADEVRAVFGDCEKSEDKAYISVAHRFLVHFTTCTSCLYHIHTVELMLG